MAKRYRQKRKGKIQSKPTTIDGIKFRSKLEAFTYEKLKVNNIIHEYESEKYVLLDGFHYTSDSYEQSTKGYRNRGEEKVRAITYLPDFLCPGRTWIIECKGFANDRFPLKWKMFKKHLLDNNKSCKLFVPKNQKQVLETIEIIKNL
tara:strand:+ start:208 stop:648 length:441 start_codon:yes stop_codon:yes gene_type:complete